MNSDDFEQQLQRQPVRAVPAEWRMEILQTADRAAAAATAGVSRPDPVRGLTPAAAVKSWWREFLWPCPQAWAGLAAAWVIILALNVNALAAKPTADNDALPATSSTMALAERRRDLSSLLDSLAPTAVVLQPALPRPRSEGPAHVFAV
jgi:hypothetical protein